MSTWRRILRARLAHLKKMLARHLNERWRLRQALKKSEDRIAYFGQKIEAAEADLERVSP